MNNENQKELNVNHQRFLHQLEQLASQAASAQAQIASDAAKHEFRVRFNHFETNLIYSNSNNSHIDNGNSASSSD